MQAHVLSLENSFRAAVILACSRGTHDVPAELPIAFLAPNN